MFKRNTSPTSTSTVQAVERVTSVLGAGIIWQGSLTGSGGVRIEGSYEGQIELSGMLMVGETGRVTCPDLRAETVIVAGSVRGNITCLLYTSDAADEEDSVDLGGRRIIKKK